MLLFNKKEKIKKEGTILNVEMEGEEAESAREFLLNHLNPIRLVKYKF